MNPLPLKKIQSFVRRGGRLSEAKEFAIDILLPKYGITYQPSQDCNWQQLFPLQQNIICEIGFGVGKTLIQMAMDNPENNYLGIEVHRPGIANVARAIETLKLNNLRLIQGDAVEFFKHALPEACLTAVYLFFPDPWPKKRHHKRRIVQNDFIHLIASRLKSGGIFHAATDWQAYAEQMMDLLSNSILINTQKNQNFAPRPNYRPETKFEARGKALGHGVWDLIFKKV